MARSQDSIGLFELQELQRENDSLREEVERVAERSSWRLTAPLREVFADR
jgi:hypothetical protein